jgi:hypothetical protein
MRTLILAGKIGPLWSDDDELGRMVLTMPEGNTVSGGYYRASGETPVTTHAVRSYLLDRGFDHL